MNRTELNKKVQKLRELKQMSEKLNGIIEELKDEIKDEMTRLDVDTLQGKDWKINWREQHITRLDAKLLERDFGDLSKYKKITTYKAFYLKDK